jgi:hypothetical protein
MLGGDAGPAELMVAVATEMAARVGDAAIPTNSHAHREVDLVEKLRELT